MKSVIVAVCVLLGMCAPAGAAVSIGINVGVYPDLVPVPGYPVYYAPQLDSNFFFYDGLYWVYTQDSWYSSPWYNGPWDAVAPAIVPLFVLRVPVRYYRQPPAYFGAWDPQGPPHWGEHWGHGWEQRRNGWDHWDRAGAPVRAPLPEYQRSYSGDRYPRVDQQLTLRNEHYNYQPRHASAHAGPPYEQTPGQRVSAVAQRRMPVGSNLRSGSSPGTAESSNASTGAAVDVASQRRDSRTPRNDRHVDLVQPPAAAHRESTQGGNHRAEQKDRRPELQQLQARQSKAQPSMPLPAQSRQPQRAQSPDRNEEASPRATAKDAKRKPEHGH